jgi:glutaminyl-tRNA synthetase
MSDKRTHFLTHIIDADLEAGTFDGRVVTRFPPEPNGYLHIGHAKSICLNFGLAQQYGGRCHLRFDDTNPTKEEQEYVDSIMADVRWLGFDWGEHLFFASDFFERMYDLAVGLVRDGKAYVCSLPMEDLRAYRGSLSEPGRPSPYRDRSAEESLDLFARMRAGEFEDGTHTLRAKIDMASPNMLMRDPLLYRIRHAHHHRTGDDWCIYPMYDYAHPIEDAIEDITHSICTLEFENNRELYDWVIDNTAVTTRPRQYEFARLALDYTVMSKRWLLKLVQDGHVDGWDDPRMPSVAGMRRRGITPEAIRAFADLIGVAKNNSMVDFGKLEFCVRDDLNHRAPRVMAVLDPLKVVIENYPEGEVETLEASYWPHDVPREGTRSVPFARELYIDRSDFAIEPPKGWKRLAPGLEVRLRYGYFIKCTDVVTDDTGAVTEVRCTYDAGTAGGKAPDGRKPNGTIHWVAAAQSVAAEVRVYDRLFTAEKPGERTGSFLDDLNPESLVVLAEARVEPSCADAEPGAHFQFERQGYFVRDAYEEALVFNRVVTLRDSWSAPKSAPAVVAKPASPTAETGRKRPPKKTRAQVRADARAADPSLEARRVAYVATGFDSDAADSLTADHAIADLLDAAVGAHPGETTVKWVVNEVLRAVKDEPVGDLKVDGAMVGRLCALLDSDAITSSAAKDVFATMLETGDEAEVIVDRDGLRQLGGAAELGPVVEKVVAANPDEAAAFRGGKKALMGFFVGQVMRETRGKANPKLTAKLLGQTLSR